MTAANLKCEVHQMPEDYQTDLPTTYVVGTVTSEVNQLFNLLRFVDHVWNDMKPDQKTHILDALVDIKELATEAIFELVKK